MLNPIRWLLALCVAGLALGAQAGPVSVSGVVSGYRGEQLTLLFNDEALADFEAADILVVFDPTVLEFVDATPGSLTPSFSVVAGPPQANGPLAEVLISMITGTAGVTGGPGSVFTTLFRIHDDAPFGQSIVRFESLDQSLYAFDRLEAPVEVLRSVLPVTGTASLSLAALAGLLGLSLLRRKPR